MKSTIKHIGIIAIVVVIGFSFAACGNGSTGGGTGFALTEVITQVYSEPPTWAHDASFIEGEEISFGIRGRAPDKDISTYVISSEEDGTEVFHDERNAAALYNQDGTFTHYIGTFPTTGIAAGTYSVDVYAVDAKGNQSNTKTVTISITEN